MPPRASTSGAAAAAGKKLTPTEKKLLDAGLNAPKGEIGQQELFAACGLAITPATQDAVNSLLRKNLIQMLKTASGSILFRFLAKEEAKAMGTMDSEEKLVLDRIKEAGNIGIWTKTLTTQTGLPRATITKALKMLEGRKAIKTVKSVKTPTRKIYMLAGIQPSVELTGGPWFTDNELDVELVEQLKKIAEKFLKSKSIPPSTQISDPSSSGPQKFRPIYPVSATPFLPSVQDVLDYIVSLEVAVVELLPEHVEALLDLMVYDGVVEKVFVRREEDDEFGGSTAKANGKAAKGKGKGKASSKGKRKKSDSGDESSESEDDRRSKKSKKSSKRSASGKAKKKRLKFDSDDDDVDAEGETEKEESDEEKSSKRKKKKKKRGGSDDDSEDESDGGKKKRKNRKKKVKRSSSDEEGSDAENGAGSSTAGSPKKPALDLDEDEPAAPASASQYVYRIIRPYHPVIGWTDMPCGRCPVEEFCAEPPRDRALAYKKPPQVASASGRMGGENGGAPKTSIALELEGGIQGVGMLGGAGAAIGVSLAKWGEMKGAVGTGIAPINPVDCPYFVNWVDF
ncbi:hypothetical protein JCM11641_003158 [Rhodosporidiobolus odoratus]